LNDGPEPKIEVVIAQDAIERLAAYADIERWPSALLVMDRNTQEAVGVRVAQTFRDAGVDIRELVFPQRSGLLADEEALATVRAQLTDRVQPVAVGSGVLTDIVRYAAHLCDREFVSVPTAASMDGYASSVAALQLDGVKVTYPARAPKAIFADPRVAAAAPPELTRSGIGDLLAKATARVDWLAAHLLYGESYSEAVAERVLEPLSFAASNVEALMAGDADAIRALLSGLVQSGIAIAIVGSSRPASGCEHHASHFWDLLAARGKRPHAPHGLQVGYATRFAMRLQRFAYAGGVPELQRPVTVEEPLGRDARAWLGEPSAEIVAAVQEKRRWIAAVPASWPHDAAAWATVRAQLAPAIELFSTVERALTLAGIPAEPGYLDVDEATLSATFRYASRLRARYTVIDFLEGQEALDEALSSMLSSTTA
jgi:glycerol-1-phosphate dehydrogenase [NAD(P)+]